MAQRKRASAKKEGEESGGDFLARVGTDAALWAQEMVLLKPFKGIDPTPGNDLHVWLCNAIEAGREAGYGQAMRGQRAGTEANLAQPITAERQPIYGHPALNFARQSISWTGKLANKLTEPLTSQDVAILMADLKLCRLMESPAHEDSILDVGGYMTCLEKVNESESTDAKETGVRENTVAEAYALGLRMKF